MRPIEKIRKMLALARDRGATEQEAASAMAMASKLMMEHDVSEEELERPPDGGELWHSELIATEGSAWRLLVAHAVGELHACRVLVTNEGASLLFASGRRLNVGAAGETYPYLCEQILKMLEERRETPQRRTVSYSGPNFFGTFSADTTFSWGGSSDFDRTFMEGCAARLVERAKEIVRHNRLEIPPSQALVVIDNALEEVDRAFQKAGIQKKEVRVSAGSGTGMGMMDADRVKIKRELE